MEIQLLYRNQLKESDIFHHFWPRETYHDPLKDSNGFILFEIVGVWKTEMKYALHHHHETIYAQPGGCVSKGKFEFVHSMSSPGNTFDKVKMGRDCLRINNCKLQIKFNNQIRKIV